MSISPYYSRYSTFREPPRTFRHVEAPDVVSALPDCKAALGCAAVRTLQRSAVGYDPTARAGSNARSLSYYHAQAIKLMINAAAAAENLRISTPCGGCPVTAPMPAQLYRLQR